MNRLIALLVLSSALAGCDRGDSTATLPGETPPVTPEPTSRDADAATASTRQPDPPAPRPEADEPSVNLSELHYAQVARVDGHSHGVERLPLEPDGTLRVAEPAASAPPWTSDEGRRASGAVLALAADAPSLGIAAKYPSGLCTPPQPYVGTMSRTMPSGRKLVSPRSTFASEQSAVAFLKGVKAKMPFYLPYRHPQARLTSGWLYGSGSSHRGQDYSRSDIPDGTDPTFAVYASAAGLVTDVFWSDLSGNIVVIEHTAPSGERYLSYQSHLRNGVDADVGRALAVNCTDVTDDRCVLYTKFAKSFATHLSWGTNAQTIAVKAGDVVKAGQFLGWAGNTGYGGAGWGLDEDGKPTSFRGNVHLHAFFGVSHPTEAATFVAVDPYGVYDKVDDKGCYDLLKDTAFDRLFAPFYPTFHGVPFEIVERYAGYYTQMGWAPRTLDVHRSSGSVRVSGAFARGIAGPFAARGYQTLAAYQASFDELLAQGLVPRQTSVTTAPGGEARFSGLFRALVPGETVERRSALDTAGWDDRWNARVIGQEWRVDDYNAYAVGGEDRFSALFSSNEGRPFVFYARRTLPELSDLVLDRRAEGFVPVKVNALDKGGSTLYAGMFRKRPGCWRTHLALSEAEHQMVTTLRVAAGYQLEHIQAHRDPAVYSTVFARPDVADPATCGW